VPVLVKTALTPPWLNSWASLCMVQVLSFSRAGPSKVRRLPLSFQVSVPALTKDNVELARSLALTPSRDMSPALVNVSRPSMVPLVH
jgi:hypothetical protein